MAEAGWREGDLGRIGASKSGTFLPQAVAEAKLERLREAHEGLRAPEGLPTVRQAGRWIEMLRDINFADGIVNKIPRKHHSIDASMNARRMQQRRSTEKVQF